MGEEIQENIGRGMRGHLRRGERYDRNMPTPHTSIQLPPSWHEKTFVLVALFDELTFSNAAGKGHVRSDINDHGMIAAWVSVEDAFRVMTFHATRHALP